MPCRSSGGHARVGPDTDSNAVTHYRNGLCRHLRLTVRCEPRMKAQSTLQPTTEGVKENESVGVGGHTTHSEVGWVVGFR